MGMDDLSRRASAASIARTLHEFGNPMTSRLSMLHSFVGATLDDVRKQDPDDEDLAGRLAEIIVMTADVAGRRGLRLDAHIRKRIHMDADVKPENNARKRYGRRRRGKAIRQG